MGTNIMESGKITVGMDGECMRISRSGTGTLGIGNKIRKVDLENKSLLPIYIRVIFSTTRRKDLVRFDKMGLGLI